MTTTPAILERMADTFRERNAVYKDNCRMLGEVMARLHPVGSSIDIDRVGADKLTEAERHELIHLWYLLIVKVTRFAVSGLTHQDSIHDIAVYAAMIETFLENADNKRREAIARAAVDAPLDEGDGDPSLTLGRKPRF